MRCCLPPPLLLGPSLLLLLLLLLLALPLLSVASALAVLALSVQAVHKPLRYVKSGGGLVQFALLAALALHSNLDERRLAVFADDPLACSADALQAASAATSAVEAVCLQIPPAPPAALLLRCLPLLAAVRARFFGIACQADAVTAP
jgi:hypothetical protein